MPARLIEHEDGVSARRDRFSDLLKMLIHGFGVGIGHDEPGPKLARGADGAEQIGPLISCIAHSAGSCSFPCPNPGERAFLPYAGLVLKPDLKGLPFGMLRQAVA